MQININPYSSCETSRYKVYLRIVKTYGISLVVFTNKLASWESRFIAWNKNSSTVLRHMYTTSALGCGSGRIDYLN
jgi:hypothetical protein